MDELKIPQRDKQVKEPARKGRRPKRNTNSNTSTSSNGNSDVNELTKDKNDSNVIKLSSTDSVNMYDTDENNDKLFALPMVPLKKCKDESGDSQELGNQSSWSNSKESLTSNGNSNGTTSQYLSGTIAVHFRTSHFEILHLTCESTKQSVSFNNSSETEYKRRSGSSGYIADVSKAGSFVSNSPENYLPLQPKHLNRMSQVSSSSSGSTIPNSASELARQTLTKESEPIEGINPLRIKQLQEKWKKSDLVYLILDHIDKLVSDSKNQPNVFQVESKAETKSLRENTKRNVSSNSSESDYISTRKVKKFKKSPLDSDEDVPDLTLVGKKVFAKWQNQRYYFGHVQQIINKNKVEVKYEDGNIQILNRNYIITDLNALMGNKVMVTEDNLEYFPGIVTLVTEESDGTFKFSVATNTGDFFVDASQIYFSEAQAKIVKKTSAQNDIFSDGNSTCSDLHPSCSGIQNKSVKEPYYYGTETDDSFQSIADDLNIQNPHINGCEIETNLPQNLNSSIKLKNLQGKLPKKKNTYEDTLLGPLNVRGNWFEGFYFLLTLSEHEPPSSDDEAQTDSEDFAFSKIAFVLDRLKQQITNGGGRIVQTIETVPPIEYEKTYLITNRPCITPAYLKCLALGIKIICHDWVVNCVIQKSLLPLIELPSGWSVEKSCFINSFERITNTPLKNINMKIAYVTDVFNLFWTEICRILGAKVSNFVDSCDDCNIIIAEETYKHRLLKKGECTVPVVNARWVVQSMFHGEKRPFDGHPSYSYFYEEPLEQI